MEANPTSVPTLRALALRQGVTPSDADLEAVQAFLATVLVHLSEIEAALPPETPPAGRYLP
jgi:hypothetical protein